MNAEGQPPVTPAPRGIVCPRCRHDVCPVRHTSRMPDGTVKRYRRCAACERRLVTVEGPPALLRRPSP